MGLRLPGRKWRGVDPQGGRVLPEDRGNLFECSQGRAPVTDKGAPAVSATWTGPRQLLITYDNRSEVDLSHTSMNLGGRFFRRDMVSVSYQRNEPERKDKSPFAGTWSGRCCCVGDIEPISFHVAQNGTIFGLKVGGAVVGGLTQTCLDGSITNSPYKTKAKVVGDRIIGTLIDDVGMAFTVNLKRSGPTVWVAPDP